MATPNFFPNLPPPQSERGYGFSPDGLSYSVAQDYPKIIGQIMAEYEARVAHPKAGETPASLQQELISPFENAGGGNQTSTVQPRMFEVGNKIVQVDPRTGRSVEVYAAPPVPMKEPTLAGPMGVDAFGAPSGTVRMTKPQWQSAFDSGTLPPQIATNFPVNTYLSAPTATATNAPVQSALPSMFAPQTNPFFTAPAPNMAAPAAPQRNAVKVWKRDANGRLIQSQ